MWQIKSRGLVSLREREGEQVKDLEMALNVEAEWVLERLSESFTSDTDRNYYQGRLDQLAQVRRILGHNQLLIEREGASNGN
jgi:hypothetical protein